MVRALGCRCLLPPWSLPWWLGREQWQEYESPQKKCGLWSASEAWDSLSTDWAYFPRNKKKNVINKKSLWVIYAFKVLIHTTNFVINITETLRRKEENQQEQQFQTSNQNNTLNLQRNKWICLEKITTRLRIGKILYRMLPTYEISKGNNKSSKTSCLQGLCCFEEQKSIWAALSK